VPCLTFCETKKKSYLRTEHVELTTTPTFRVVRLRRFGIRTQVHRRLRGVDKTVFNSIISSRRECTTFIGGVNTFNF